MGLIRFPQVVQGLWKHRLSSLPVQQFLKRQGDGAKVIHNDKEEANGQPQTPQRRGLHNDHAQQNENRHVAEEFCVVDGEGHIAPCVHDADAVAGEVADQRCNGCAHDAPDADEEDVQHDVHNGSHQIGPQGVGRVLGCGVHAAEELVEAHDEHRQHQNRCVLVCGGVLRIGAGVD